MSNYIREFESLGLENVAIVGGKNASLGELIRCLTKEGINVPTGFAITTAAFDALMAQNDVREKLRQILAGVDARNTEDLSRRAGEARSLIRQNGLPRDLMQQITRAYESLEFSCGKGVGVAVRSSATAEDLPDASFAGQQESFLNVIGEVALLDACLNCFASLFTDRAISYRADRGFDQLSVKLSIGVQAMVRSDLATAGVMFTLDPESGFRNAILITSAYGLGENVVAGKVDPDEFLVFKPTLATHESPIIRRKIGAKQMRMIYSGHGTRTTRNIDVPPEQRERLSLTDAEVKLLAQWGAIIEKHYSARYGKPTSMDIEWAKDGADGRLYIVQARPETVHSVEDPNVLNTARLLEKSKLLLSGRSIGEKIGSGVSRVITSPSELKYFKEGDVLVADMTDPDWEPVMKKAAAIITNRGGRTCHAAIVSRELGVPCVVGTGTATEVLASPRPVTVSCAEGANGSVYEGILPVAIERTKLNELPWTRTKILVNVANPEHAFKLSSLPVDGVGLARLEFIIANEIKVHPLALTRFEEVTDASIREAIAELTRNFISKEEYFIAKLAEGVAMIAAAFFPKEVIVRLSDFKTNEYANLLGGSFFEPVEDNPMIGFRGASRYYDPKYCDGFALECKALAKVRNDMGLTNIKVMIPFCRTVHEAQLVLAEMAKNGLVHGQNGLEVYVMCELPSNVLSIKKFAEIFDGFSIGSNDLTQLVLGLDRDSEIVARLFDERDESVKTAIRIAIEGAHQANRKIGICGQAPSDYPDFMTFLVENSIDSVSLNEDAVLKTLILVAETERRLNVVADRGQLKVGESTLVGT